jgi:LmbE family N-acetylglucosaminyl deacetylase
MLTLPLANGNQPLSRILCLGAHCDDIEIGCAGTLMRLAAENPGLHCDWVVFSSNEVRAAEARAGAAAVLGQQCHSEVMVKEFRNGFFPSEVVAIKEFFEQLKKRPAPDLILTHYRGDRHQDHRTIAELTWNTFRDHLILEYEIPKYDGDLGQPNLFVPLDRASAERKSQLIVETYASQSDKQWFSADTFSALMRLRGIEANSPSGFAEAFYATKLCVAPPRP